jgi:hypothetical protein
MIRHQETLLAETPLFRFGIFISSALPWVWDNSAGIDVTALIIRGSAIPVQLPELRAAIETAEEAKFDSQSWLNSDGISPALMERVKEVPKRRCDYEKYLIHRMHPDHDTVRLQVPTAHILGRADFAYEGGKKLRDLCELRCSQIWEHPGGHSIPRTPGIDVLMMREIIEKTVSRSEFGV